MPRLLLSLTLAGAVVVTAGCASTTSTSAVPASPAPAPAVTVSTQKTIMLPGKGGHGDVVLADPGAHAVYVAQSPDNNLVVIDTTNNTIKAVLPNIADANGIAYNDAYVYVAESGADVVAVIAKSSWQVVATVPSGGNEPDAVYYVPDTNSVFVANVKSNNMEQFSATAPFSATGTIPLQPSPAKDGPDLGTYSATEDRIYQADENAVLVINPRTRAIEKMITLPLPNGETTKDMYYDQGHKLLWMATSAPEVLAVDPASGTVVATVKTASGGDEVAVDAKRGLLFVGEKSGVIGVIDMNTHRNVTDVKTEKDFHTLDYLPDTGMIYAYLNDSNKVDVDRVSAP